MRSKVGAVQEAPVVQEAECFQEWELALKQRPAD
jgi:hypothetical protein